MTVDEILLDTDRVCPRSAIREMLEEAVKRAYANEISSIVSEAARPGDLPFEVRTFIWTLPNLTSEDYQAIRAIYEKGVLMGEQ